MQWCLANAIAESSFKTKQQQAEVSFEYITLDSCDDLTAENLVSEVAAGFTIKR